MDFTIDVDFTISCPLGQGCHQLNLSAVKVNREMALN